jgi:hypothetical protein
VEVVEVVVEVEQGGQSLRLVEQEGVGLRLEL